MDKSPFIQRVFKTQKIKNLLSSENFHKILGFLSIIISLLIGLLTFQNGVFVDEEDNLALGWLVLQGMLPYRDAFSHHFPLAYYWVSFIFLFFPKSIFASRLSILLLQLFSFAIVMVITKKYISIGFASITWFLIRNYFLGNMVLYSSLAAPFLLLVFSITLVSILDRQKKDALLQATHGISSFLALMSTPLALYAIVISYFAIFINKIKYTRSFLYLISLLSASLFALHVTKSLDGFYHQAIAFNIDVYSRYNSFYGLQVGIQNNPFINALVNFLGLNNVDLYSLDPFRDLNIEQIDKWFFTGFLFRISLIFSSIFFLSVSRYMASAFNILFAAALLAIDQWGFRGQPFVMSAIFACYFTLEQMLSLGKVEVNKQYLILPIKIISLFILLTIFWLNFRLVQNLSINPKTSYRELYPPVIARALYLKSLSCNQDDVRLVYYPGGYVYYFFSDLKPLTKHLAMWPWMAEVGKNEVLTAIRNPNIKTIVVIESATIWERYSTTDYLKELYDYLGANYIKKGDLIYLSPELAKRCKTN